MGYSPVLAEVTAGLEIAVAGWALWRGRRRASMGTIATILLFLAGYQVTEVAICSDAGAAGFLPRLAFLVVTWLPPLGVLLVAQLRSGRSRLFFGAAGVVFAAGLGMAAWILSDPAFASVSTCNVVFARYMGASTDLLAYGVYYWTGLLLMLVLSLLGALRATGIHERESLGLVFGGSAAFIAPSILMDRYSEPAKGALPSVMCHFALLFAAALVWVICTERARADGASRP